MNKAELIDAMAQATKQSKSVCKDVLESFLTTVGKSLKKGNAVVLTGFGTFDVVERKERVGINPATGEKIKIKKRRMPKFKAGKNLKDLVH